MSLLPYKSSGWNTHSERKLREIDFPLFDGDQTHFTLRRFYIGPRETYVPAALDTVDAVYNGVAASITGTASTDLVAFASAKKFLTGDPVLLTVTTGLTGLTTATTYYLIRISDTTFKLATTRALAIAGTAINITADGTGTLTPSAAYLVEQSTLTDADADQYTYERLFATVPASWSDYDKSFAHEFPAFAATSFGVFTVSFTTITWNGTSHTINTGGFSAGDRVYVNVKYTFNNTVVQQTFMTLVISAPSGSTTAIAGISVVGPGTFSSVSGTISLATIGRLAPKNIAADGREQCDYALVSSATLAASLPLVQPFTPVDSTGAETDTLSLTTVPTAAAYAALVAAGTEIVVACTRSRYLGNIFVRKTQLVPAL